MSGEMKESERLDARADELWAKSEMTERDVEAAQKYRDRAAELRKEGR